MPHKSTFPDVCIPNCDLWDFMFARASNVKQPQVIYRDATSCIAHTVSDVREASREFGLGLMKRWKWEKGQVLAVFAPNHVDTGALIHGALFAGGITCPLNPESNSDELTYAIKDSGAVALVTVAARLPVAMRASAKAGISPSRIILLDQPTHGSHDVKHWSEIRVNEAACVGELPVRPNIDPAHDLAFLVYSSGTTGVPKGVMLSHRNIIADLMLVERAVGKSYTKPTTRLLSILPFSHIYGLVGLVLQPLYLGIESVVIPKFELQAFLTAIQRHKITFIYAAPPVVIKLTRDPSVLTYDLSSVEMITSGAAPLSRELVETVYQKLNIKVNQAYGLSETSPMTHTQPWGECHRSIGSVGKLFPNMTAKLMTPEGKEAESGCSGELWLRGPNVFQGYWKNLDATNECMTSDGYFKTGDIGYIDAEDNLFIVDRIKELIKYNGFQVAPAELEAKLMEHPYVLDAAVIGVYIDEKATELCRAYIVTEPERRTESVAEELKVWFAGGVSHYKTLTGGVRFVDQIPKSPSGKILRKVLKAQAQMEKKGRQQKARL